MLVFLPPPKATLATTAGATATSVPGGPETRSGSERGGGRRRLSCAARSRAARRGAVRWECLRLVCRCGPAPREGGEGSAGAGRGWRA